ncbi:hypothetical protein NDU88_008254 [Pleurodeles waltl]|uniref:Uncharacterized protein n=1 Tax=Pleurodeles waltl TaxID=8319 RepID=A0AAV7RWC6_PLEWA|nr:hypothetical protein NDU88_008254 [Pleurodeles waltl]
MSSRNRRDARRIYPAGSPVEDLRGALQARPAPGSGREPSPQSAELASAAALRNLIDSEETIKLVPERG